MQHQTMMMMMMMVMAKHWNFPFHLLAHESIVRIYMHVECEFYLYFLRCNGKFSRGNLNKKKCMSAQLQLAIDRHRQSKKTQREILKWIRKLCIRVTRSLIRAPSCEYVAFVQSAALFKKSRSHSTVLAASSLTCNPIQAISAHHDHRYAAFASHGKLWIYKWISHR